MAKMEKNTVITVPVNQVFQAEEHVPLDVLVRDPRDLQEACATHQLRHRARKA